MDDILYIKLIQVGGNNYKLMSVKSDMLINGGHLKCNKIITLRMINQNNRIEKLNAKIAKQGFLSLKDALMDISLRHS